MKRTKNNQSLRILAMDPSLTAWGYVIIASGQEIIESGCIKTESENKKRRIRKGDDDSRRVSEIAEYLNTLIDTYNINYLIAELPHGSQSASGMKMVGIVLGLTSAMAITLDIPLEWYSEADAKKALLGKRSATKKETIDAIDKCYNVTWLNVKYKDEAIADSIAVYHVARIQSPTIKMFLK